MIFTPHAQFRARSFPVPKNKVSDPGAQETQTEPQSPHNHGFEQLQYFKNWFHFPDNILLDGMESVDRPK